MVEWDTISASSLPKSDPTCVYIIASSYSTSPGPCIFPALNIFVYGYGCHNLEQAFLSTEDCGVKRYRRQESSEASIGTFPCLKHLEFWDNWKLSSLCDSNVTFPSMESLKFLCCPELKTLSLKMESLPPKLTKLEMDKSISSGGLYPSLYSKI